MHEKNREGKEDEIINAIIHLTKTTANDNDFVVTVYASEKI